MQEGNSPWFQKDFLRFTLTQAVHIIELRIVDHDQPREQRWTLKDADEWLDKKFDLLKAVHPRQRINNSTTRFGYVTMETPYKDNSISLAGLWGISFEFEEEDGGFGGYFFIHGKLAPDELVMTWEKQELISIREASSKKRKREF